LVRGDARIIPGNHHIIPMSNTLGSWVASGSAAALPLATQLPNVFDIGMM